MSMVALPLPPLLPHRHRHGDRGRYFKNSSRQRCGGGSNLFQKIEKVHEFNRISMFRSKRLQGSTNLIVQYRYFQSKIVTSVKFEGFLPKTIATAARYRQVHKLSRRGSGRFSAAMEISGMNKNMFSFSNLLLPLKNRACAAHVFNGG